MTPWQSAIRLVRGLHPRLRRILAHARAWLVLPAAPTDPTPAPSEALPAVQAWLRRPLAAVGVFSIVMNLLALVVPIYMSLVYDRVLTSYSAETLLMLTAIALGLLGVFVALDGIRARLLTQMALKAEQSLGPPLLAAAVKDQLAGRSDAGLALRDLSALRVFASSAVVPALFDAPLVPLYVLVTFSISWVLGLVALLGTLFMLALTALNQRATAKSAEKANRASQALLLVADQQTRNADVIEAMGLMPSLKAHWEINQDGVLKAQQGVHDRGGVFQTATRYLRLSLQVLVLAFGAALVLGDSITPGMMFAASIILSRGLQPVEAAVGSWRALIVARGQFERIRDALARLGATPQPMALPAPKGRIEVENVVVVLGAERRQVLRGVSFEVPAGTSLGIIGPAASGKSTLARVILGVVAAQIGKVRLDGADVAQWDREALGHHIGYLPQEVELFPATVAQNIARMGTTEPDAVVAAARLAGVHDMILRLPQGYDTRIMAGGLMISPGQRQRIALARAFFGAPRLLVLDEPNANLDGEGEDALCEALRIAKERAITVIIIAHRLGALRLTDNLLLLRDGAVQAFGPRDEVLSRLAPRPGHVQNGSVAPVLNVVPRQGNTP